MLESLACIAKCSGLSRNDRLVKDLVDELCTDEFFPLHDFQSLKTYSLPVIAAEVKIQ